MTGRIDNEHFLSVMFGVLTPITLTSLYRTMWLYRIPVDRRDWTRVWALFGAWVMSNVLHQTGVAEAELFRDIMMTAVLFSFVYLVLGQDKNVLDF